MGNVDPMNISIYIYMCIYININIYMYQHIYIYTYLFLYIPILRTCNFNCPVLTKAQANVLTSEQKHAHGRRHGSNLVYFLQSSLRICPLASCLINSCFLFLMST